MRWSNKTVNYWLKEVEVEVFSSFYDPLSGKVVLFGSKFL